MPSEAIRSIPQKTWKRYDSEAYPHKGSEIAETVHAFGEADKDIAAFRLVVVRWPKEQQELFDAERFEYRAVATRFIWEPGLVLQFHRNRQDGSENVNKEMKSEGGFALSKLPCRDFWPMCRLLPDRDACGGGDGGLPASGVAEGLAAIHHPDVAPSADPLGPRLDSPSDEPVSSIVVATLPRLILLIRHAQAVIAVGVGAMTIRIRVAGMGLLYS